MSDTGIVRRLKAKYLEVQRQTLKEGNHNATSILAIKNKKFNRPDNHLQWRRAIKCGSNSLENNIGSDDRWSEYY